MLLTIDLGNTNIVFGCFDGKELRFQFRLKTDLERTVDEHVALFHVLVREFGGDVSAFTSSILSSVVPPLTGTLIESARRVTGSPPVVVNAQLKTGVALNVANPSSVGADRIVNVVAAKALYGCPALVLDFGTATTFDVLSKDGNYEGGVICPGPNVAVESLVRRTAQLQRIDLVWPEKTVGKTTIDQMQSGAVIGYASLVDGLIDRIRDEAGPFSHVIATGGLGRLFAERSKKIDVYEPSLTLQGLRVLAEWNGKQSA